MIALINNIEPIITETMASKSNWSIENFISIGVLTAALLTLIINLIVSKWQIKNALKSINLQIQSSRDIAEQEIKRDVRSSNRMVWINDLRNTVSEYISNHEYIKLTSQNDLRANTGIPTPEWKEGFKKFTTVAYKIELLLNPDEDKSKEMLRLMTELNLATDYHSKKMEVEYERIKNEILGVTKSILKEEWNRVKNLE